MPSSEDIKLDFARAYAKIGDKDRALFCLDSVSPDMFSLTPKYLGIKSEVLEANENFKGALEVLKEYIIKADSITNSLIEQDVWFVERKYELEGYSPCINSVISLTESDYHTIVIEGEDWIASGVIE